MKFVSMIIAAILCASALSAPIWHFEEIERGHARWEESQYSQYHIPRGEHGFARPSASPFDMPDWHAYPRFSYPHYLAKLCDFWAYWQLMDIDSAEHGGIIEAETGELRDVIQTDNTQEVVWDWAFYTDRSGDSTYLENIDSAWVYLGNFPAYMEELSEIDPTFTSYYYRVWNSSLGLLMLRGLRDFLGETYPGYADSCVDVVMFERLPMDTEWESINGLHALVNAFAAGCLYQWGLDYTTVEYCDTAVSIAYQVQEWIDRDTVGHLAYSNWAMSSGTIIWGMMNSRFTAMPESLDAWLDIYGPYIPNGIAPPDDYDPYVWDNSWNIWFANGFRAIWNLNGDLDYYTKYRTILDNLLVQDTDDDGGIPASAVGPDYEDMTWISAYLLLYAMDWVIDSLPETDAGALNPTVHMPKGWATADDTVYIVARAGNFGNGDLEDVPITITLDWGILLDTTVNFAWGEVLSPDPFAVVPGAEGTHVVEVHTYLSDSNPWNDTARVEFEATPVRGLSGAVMDAGDSTAVEAEIFFHLSRSGTSSILDSIATDDMGGYFIDLPCFAYDVEIRPEFPYWGEVFHDVEVIADGCNLRNFLLKRADMAVVEDDTGAGYIDYYQFCFDTIGATYRIWNRDSLGDLPGPISGEMRRHTIFWFTGDDSSTTLDSSDIASLSYILANGGNIVLSGQGIMEDLHDNPEFLGLISAEWLSADGSPVVNGVPGDPISGDLGQMMLLGGGSAGNQRHQDRLTPVAPAEGFLTYSTGSGYAGVRYEHPTSGGKIVFCAFGIEGVPYPAVSSAFTDRIGLIDPILKWFDPTYDVPERTLPTKFALHAYPNPFNGAVNISVDFRSESAERLSTIEVFDVNGRRVAQLPVGEHLRVLPNVDETENGRAHRPSPTQDVVVWRPDQSLGSGVYLVRASIGDCERTARVVYLK